MTFNLNKFGFGTVEQKPTPKEKEAGKLGYVEKKPTPQENAEIKNLNRSTDIDIHDPYRNPLEGVVNVPGSDVVDPATYYNEPGHEGFEDENEIPGNPIDNSETGGEVGAFMKKYNLEEFELEKLMADCEAYQNGKKIPAPLRDSHDLQELALLYRDYEGAKHDGLPFNDEELSKISEKNQEELVNLYKKRSDLIFKVPENNGATLTLRPEVIAKKLDEIKEQIAELEAPIYKKVLKVDRELEKRAQDARNDARNNDPKLWKDVPKYSEADLALQKNVLAYIRQEEGAKKPVFSSGEKLTKEQIEDVLREIAEDEKWPKANFFAEARKINRNGREQEIRQLATVENLSNSRRAKYTFASDNLPDGQYFYQADLKSAVISKNNPNLAFAPISLFISAERSKKNVSEVASEEVIDKPRSVIVKKEKLQDKPAPTIIKKGSPVEKPAPVIKKRVPEEVM